jgi:transposase
MPRYKEIDRGMKLLPIDLSVQLLPGTFEHALSHLIDHELDLRGFDERFRNDESGAPAYAPSMMLTVILDA